MGFKVMDKYRLELHWSKVIYEQDDIALLKGAYFVGPVLKEAAQMNQEDQMRLDFRNQYILVLPRYYIATLSWKGVNQTTNKVILKNVILTNNYINAVPKLNDTDYILIDTTNHTDEKHQLYFNYDAYLLNVDKELYVFGR